MLTYNQLITLSKKIKIEYDNGKIDEIMEMISYQKLTIGQAIELLKLSEINFTQNTENSIFTQLLQRLKKVYVNNVDKIEEYKESMDTLHYIYQSIPTKQEMSMKSRKTKISKRGSFAYFCIYIHDIFQEFLGENTEINYCYRERIIEYFNFLYPEYQHQKIPILNQRFSLTHLNTEVLNELFSHIQDYVIYDRMKELIEKFRCNFLDFYKIGNQIYTKYNKKYDRMGIEIAKQDYQNKLNVSNIFLTDNVNEIYRYMDQNMEVYVEKLKMFFMCEDETIIILGIEMQQWIKAYLLLSKQCLEFYEQNKCSMLVKKRSEWKTLFVSNGFNPRDADIIIQYFSYYDNSTDVRETPLIPYGDVLFVIPLFVITADIYQVLISFFNKNRFQLASKGKYYEKLVLSSLKKLNITCCTHQEKEYDCDVAFIFDECLFICELKNEIQAMYPFDWYRFYQRNEKNIKQIDRIYQYYSKNKERLLEKLGKSKNYVPKHIFKLILYSNYIGNTMIKDNTMIVNYKDLINFFSREVPTTHVITNKTILICRHHRDEYQYLQKEVLTIEDFLTYIKKPIQTKYQEDRFTLKEQKIMLKDDYYLNFTDYLYDSTNML